MPIISQTIPIIGPQCSLLGATFAKEHILGTCSWKNGHGNLGIKLKTSTFLKMAPQAKPLCSRDAHRNSVQNPGLHSPRSLTTTPKP